VFRCLKRFQFDSNTIFLFLFFLAQLFRKMTHAFEKCTLFTDESPRKVHYQFARFEIQGFSKSFEQTINSVFTIQQGRPRFSADRPFSEPPKLAKVKTRDRNRSPATGAGGRPCGGRDARDRPPERRKAPPSPPVHILVTRFRERGSAERKAPASPAAAQNWLQEKGCSSGGGDGGAALSLS